MTPSETVCPVRHPQVGQTTAGAGPSPEPAPAVPDDADVYGRHALYPATRPGDPVQISQRGTGRVAVPPRDDFDVDEHLSQLSRWGWTLIAYGDRTLPEPLVAYQQFGDHIDVLIIAGADATAAYRAPVWPDQDPLDVEHVTWCLIGPIDEVLHRFLALGPINRGWPLYPMPGEVAALKPATDIHRLTIRPPQP